MHTNWPRAYSGPLAIAQFRTTPESFQVDEIRDDALSGDGDYLYLLIRKRDIDTASVVSELSKLLGIKPRNISYAGRKDRFAVATQWFCVTMPKQNTPELGHELHEKFSVLRSQRHHEPLAIGDLTANRFTILLTDFDGDVEQTTDTLEHIKRQGFPNYFGPQRFGSKGQNLVRGRRMLAGDLRVRDKNQRSMYLSACRSFLFNEILAVRVRQRSWTTCIEGEQSSIPTGYLPGDGEVPVSGEAGRIVRTVLEQHQELYTGIKNSRVAWHQRDLLVQATELEYQWRDNQLELTFSLPKGAFATSLLRELIELA